MVSALGDAQTLRIQRFERWVFSFEETRTLSAKAFAGITNTMISASCCIPLDKYNTFGPGERSAGSFRALKPLRVQCQTCFMNCSHARSIVLSNKIEFGRVGEIPSDRQRHPLLESAKRKKYLFRRTKRGRHFVHKSNTSKVLLASPSISLHRNNTFIADELSGPTNTVLPETRVDFVQPK